MTTKNQNRVRIGIILLIVLLLILLFTTCLADREIGTSCYSCSVSSQNSAGFELPPANNTTPETPLPPKNVTPGGNGTDPNPPNPPTPIDLDAELYDYKLWVGENGDPDVDYLRVLLFVPAGNTVDANTLLVEYDELGGTDSGEIALTNADISVYESISSGNYYLIKLSGDILTSNNVSSGVIYTYTFSLPTLSNDTSVNYPFESGDGVTEPFEMTHVVQLDAMRYYTGAAGAGKDFELTTDIEIPAEWNTGSGKVDRAFVDGKGWVPIGEGVVDTMIFMVDSVPFSGNFNGNGHEITGLFIEQSFDPQVDYETAVTGLFGCADGATFEDVKLDEINIMGSLFSGGLLGYGTDIDIQNVDVSGNLTADTYGGGLVGYVDGNGNIIECNTNVFVNGTKSSASMGGLIGEIGYMADYSVGSCKAYGNVSGLQEIGGLIGQTNYATIQNCEAFGDVEGYRDYTNPYSGLLSPASGIGGLVGKMIEGTVSECNASGSVIGTQYVGGLIGDNSYASVTNCHANGETIEGGFAVGGLIGGGGYMTVVQYHFVVENCSYTGNSVSGNHSAGGLIGWVENITVNNCYLTGDVLPSQIDISMLAIGGYGPGTGGLIGHASRGCVIENSYATGSVTFDNSYSGGYGTGGLIGYINQSSVDNCYAQGGEIKGADNTGGLVGFANTGTTIKTSVVLTEEITTTGTNKGRVVGYNAAGNTLQNNYAVESMTGGTWTPAANGKDGADVSDATAKTLTFYSNAPLSWSISADGIGTIWRIDNNNAYPVLSWQTP
ncbi:GLUG motif-containing protein [Methanolapillus africanus]|uniref:GLUG motif-containing protein n=1 Tax=Methanolapillus africanus TaxID=3028297 RepID=UPI0030B871BE